MSVAKTDFIGKFPEIKSNAEAREDSTDSMPTPSVTIIRLLLKAEKSPNPQTPTITRSLQAKFPKIMVPSCVRRRPTGPNGLAHGTVSCVSC